MQLLSHTMLILFYIFYDIIFVKYATWCVIVFTNKSTTRVNKVGGRR